MSELKPCPFCGTENTDVGFIAHTEKCYLMLRYMGGHSKKELGIAWNTRPIEDKLQAEIERLTAKTQVQDALESLQEAKIEWLTDINHRLMEDAKRMASKRPLFRGEMDIECIFCGAYSPGWETVRHLDDCPYVLHNQLMAELEGRKG